MFGDVAAAAAAYAEFTIVTGGVSIRTDDAFVAVVGGAGGACWALHNTTYMHVKYNKHNTIMM